MNKEEILLQKRFVELSQSAFQKNRLHFTDFLNLNDLQILYSVPKQSLYTPFRLFGGYPLAERKRATFFTEKEDDVLFPIAAIRVSPLKKTFAEEMTHRDYLGALLNVGIERQKTGDILVEEKEAIFFIEEALSSFVCESLTRVRHTSVKAEVILPEEFSYTPRYEIVKGSVASVRLDSLLALAFGFSRSSAVEYIENGKTFVNGKRIVSNAYPVKEEDIISVRGVGRFSFQGIGGQSKKKRDFVELWKYV